jgi:hypothetical protein
MLPQKPLIFYPSITVMFFLHGLFFKKVRAIKKVSGSQMVVNTATLEIRALLPPIQNISFLKKKTYISEQR